MFVQFWDWVHRRDSDTAAARMAQVVAAADEASKALAKMSTTAGALGNALAASFVAGTAHSPEFSGSGFSAGAVQGARAWNIDDDGWLVGVMRPQVWVPGENHAECRRFVLPPVRSVIINGSSVPVTVSPGRVSVEPAEHPIQDCGHGFYAFYEGSNDYGRPARVSGVIQGYGKTVIGSRGFRCMKARILAITFGDEVSEQQRAKVTANYPGSPVFDSFDEMVAAYPPDRGETEPPIEPNEWVREA